MLLNDTCLKTFYDVVVIVPCFNEAKRMEFIPWIDFITTRPHFLFIFINDGSVDETGQVLIKNISTFSNVVLIQNTKNEGKAGAVRSGILHAYTHYNYQYISFIDADLSSPLTELDRFASILNEKTSIDFILGSRIQMLGKKIKRNLFRHYIGRVIATFICRILNEPVYDTQCGIKMFRKEILNQLVQQPFLSRWLFDVEILARYKVLYGSTAFNEKIIEVPVKEWIEKEYSKLRYYQFPIILFDLMKINQKYFHTSRT